MIFIHKNDSTVFADQEKFLTFHIKTNKNLTGWKAEFVLCSVKKTILDISSKSFEVILTAKDTSKLYYGKPFGELRLIDNKGNIKTIANNIPFCVTKDIVENESQIIDLDIPESSEIEVSVSYKAPSGGTTNYEELENIPSINGVELIGEKSLEELGIQPQGDYLKEHQDISHLASKVELEQGLETKQPKGDYASPNDIPDISNLATKGELIDKANNDDVVHISGTEVINGAKTFNSAVNFIGSGDSNSVGISENTRFNIHNTNKTILGMGNGLFYINHGDYRLRLRGKDVRPHYNTDSNFLALLSDIPNTSNLATKTEVMQMIASIPQFSLKVVAELPTTGEKMTLYLVPKEGSGNDVYNEFVWIEEINAFEFIGTTAVDLTDYALKSEIVKDFQAPIVYGGLETSASNISYDDNGRAYLNDKAFWASIPELLPSVVGEDRNQNLNFRDSMSSAERAELRFLKLKGFNGVYPQLNLDGYNVIIHNFAVGDIIMADKFENTVQICFGKLENDCTFIPKLICRLQGTSSDFYKFAKIMYLYEPSSTSLNTSSGAWDGDYYMEYRESNSFKTISYKRQNELGGIENFYGVKFIEKDGAYSLAWVTETGEIVEPSGSTTIDELDFNCVVFGNYTLELPRADVGSYGFDPTKYFVANGTIDNVVARMTDGTGFKTLGLNYKEDEFEVVENKLSLKTKIQPITEADFEALENKDSNTLYLIEE